MRKLASIRTIDAITPIEGADAIECVTIGGWKCVANKGEFKVGARCVYFEVDSILPASDERYKFLEKSFKEFHTEAGSKVLGHRLKTIKLRGQISQGLALPTESFPEVAKYKVDDDVTTVLGINKYEAAVSGNNGGNRGKTRGFPSFLIKSDQERCQNMGKQIFADMDKLYEVTQKLDGQSGTFFYRDGTVGLCSRNLQLAPPVGVNPTAKPSLWERIKGWFKKADTVEVDDLNSNWHKAAAKYDIFNLLKQYGQNIALQGEIISPTIQAGYEKVNELAFKVYAVQDINKFSFMPPAEATLVVRELNKLVTMGVTLEYVPVLHDSVSLSQLGISNMEQLLAFAEGVSLLNPAQKVREGVVFKAVDGGGSFKVVSNQYLLKNDKKD